VLLETNTSGIHRMPFGIMAVTGLAHLGLNNGMLYLVEEKNSDEFVVRKWKVLPGAPRRSGFLKNGSLFVSCANGVVMITPDGDMKMWDGAQ